MLHHGSHRAGCHCSRLCVFLVCPSSCVMTLNRVWHVKTMYFAVDLMDAMFWTETKNTLHASTWQPVGCCSCQCQWFLWSRVLINCIARYCSFAVCFFERLFSGVSFYGLFIVVLSVSQASCWTTSIHFAVTTRRYCVGQWRHVLGCCLTSQVLSSHNNHYNDNNHNNNKSRNLSSNHTANTQISSSKHHKRCTTCLDMRYIM